MNQVVQVQVLDIALRLLLAPQVWDIAALQVRHSDIVQAQVIQLNKFV
jgi:hypothetical protein